MARPKKAKTRTKKKKTRTRTSPSRARKKPAQKKKTSRAKGKGKGSEVETRWSEYWARRKELEDAVAEVERAQESLSAAIAVERERRNVFEQSKRGLEALLEVESPSKRPAPAPPGRVIGLEKEP